MAPYSPITLCHNCYEHEASHAVYDGQGHLLYWNEQRCQRLFCKDCIDEFPISNEWSVRYVDHGAIERFELETLQQLHDHLVERGICASNVNDKVWLSGLLWTIRTDQEDFDELWGAVCELDLEGMTATELVTLMDDLRSRFGRHWMGL